MPFTPTDFHGRLDTDLWVIEQILLLPSDPVPNVTEKPDGTIEIAIVDTVAMPQMQDAVAEYRRHLLPVVFVVTQKVYAELFRVMLWQNGRDVGERQYDIERVLQPLVASGSVTAWHPFQDAAAFFSWWSGRYDFVTLRKARNQVVHKCYTFAAGRLTVADDGGTQLLSWTEAEILAFAKAVLERAKRV